MTWEKDSMFTNVWTVKESFNYFTYKVTAIIDKTPKSDKFWISAGSGKKRKELDIWEEKPNKSLGGLKALLWMKRMVLDFPNYYVNSCFGRENKRRYLIIAWSDNRRRNIYERLLKEGFVFTIQDNKKVLMKKF